MLVLRACTREISPLVFFELTTTLIPVRMFVEHHQFMVGPRRSANGRNGTRLLLVHFRSLCSTAADQRPREHLTFTASCGSGENMFV